MIRSVFQCLITSSGVFRRFLESSSTSLCQFLSWTTSQMSHLWWPVQHYPLTPDQREERRQAFIQSISKSSVGALASRYNNQKGCLVSDVVRHGSYNVCLFVSFPMDKIRWVVRIPISPLVSDGWNKLQSEVATMQYVSLDTFWAGYNV